MMTVMTRRAGIIAIALFALVLGGCAVNDDQPASDAQLLVYEVDAGQGSPEAAFEGELTVDDGHGYVHGVLDDGTEFGMIFPEGTTTTRDGAGVRLPGGSVIALEEEVVLTGGYTATPEVSVPEPGYNEYFLVADATD